ncbi:hypothetical protein [Streptomyces sp. NBRC 109706]|uniref:hypothetical protein n=1 Tax=Streptomyces sp. NBRC 109706 TaxID=1550035 RepID=UPI001F159532|nr:hypothetical protein [Streptomyces sp. NBRC 109706]
MTYPEPERTMTAEQCQQGLGTTQSTYILSRFASCSGAAFLQTWTQNGRVVGQSQFIVLTVATVEPNSRTVNFQWHFTDMIAVGTTQTSALFIEPETSIPLVVPSSAQIGQGGNVPTRQSFDQMRALGGFLHTLTVSAGQGQAPDDLVSAVYEPTIHLTFPTGVNGTREGDLFILPPRWDAASYLHNDTRGGAASLAYIGYLDYSTAEDAPEREVAEHLEWALTTPEETYPPNSEKHIAGGSLNDPLNRLFHDQTRRNRNRSIAVSTCRTYWGADYTQGGLYECDEFPFATTYQGCSAPRYTDGGYDPTIPVTDCSAFPLLATDNSAAGQLLGQFYDKNRVVDGYDDAFIVRIH